MKKFLYNMRLIWKTDKEAMGGLIVATIIFILFPSALSFAVSPIFLFAIAPIVFMWYKYYTTNSKLIAEVEHEIYLEKKYPFMHNRFTKEET